MSSLVWLRRDLRVHDNPALNAALEQGGGMAAVFCFDERLLHGRHASGARTQFLLECLADIDASLRARGSRLVVRRGDPAAELAALASEIGATSVHASADAGPFARSRDRAASAALAAAGAALHMHAGTFVIDDLDAVHTTDGRPFSVFSPFHRAWLRAPRRAVEGAPPTLPPLPEGLAPGALPSLRQLGLSQPLSDPAAGGEGPARQAVERFLDGPLASYHQRRDDMGSGGSSRLSPYLHFGSISPRELESRLGTGSGAEAFHRQLCWRDFYGHVMHAFPSNAHAEHQERYRGTIHWAEDEELFEAWREGRTGYPLVDAAMRQLLREGWMHNRARLVAGSFLTKHLGIDWRRGERHFMELLIDGDQASNNGNWQWIASVGVDPQPAFKRIYNPALQQRRHDPSGRYVRRYVEELQDVPDEYLAEPWKMPDEVQRACGCRIGIDYPLPVVEHAAARREALERYAVRR